MQKIVTFVCAALLCGATAAEQAALLVYKVWEPGMQPYFSRFLVTEDYVRIDEGGDTGGYTLLDRRQEILYNVSTEEQSVLVMQATAPVPTGNAALVMTERTSVDEGAPLVGGHKPRNVTLLTNGQTCVELVAVDNLMADAVDGLRDLKTTLSRLHAATLGALPPEMQTPCDLSENVYAAGRVLNFGLPIQERSDKHSQSLVDFDAAVEVDGAVFSIPADYLRTAMPGMPAI